MRVIDLIRRLREEFTSVPDLRLTTWQVERLFTADSSKSTSALHALVSAGFLTRGPDGRYGRADHLTSAPIDTTTGAPTRLMPSPWRRILCLVDLDNEHRHALTTVAHSALRYATTLAVTHRARVTALQVIPQRLSESVRTSVTSRLRRSVLGEPLRGLIDVHVTSGSANEEVLRVAQDVHADLIVVGRSGHRDGEALPHLPEILRQAHCHVLIVHPSGRAAVA
jgi:nucleotide-binding universal stress UspA family protein